MLFASTAINYMDRQTLSLLAPYLKVTYHWTNSDYANLVIAFRVAYAIGQTACGRWMDRVGTRLGITITVCFYSLASILTPLANGFLSFMGFRVLLGFGESANWPAATKAVSEWFPAKERALATAFFDSGSSIGGAISPFVVLWIYFHWGWRPAFIVPGILGLIWLLVWRKFYYSPEEHPAYLRCRTRYAAPGEAIGRGFQYDRKDALARPSSPAADLGRHCGSCLHRPGLVLRHGLVSDLPCCEGNRSSKRPHRDMGSFSRR